MARYIASNTIPAGCAGHEFIGWDDLNGLSVEATRPDHLGILVARNLRKEFSRLKPGQRVAVPTGSILRSF